METVLDNFPVSQLQSRFNIGKQAVYNRLDALDIKPFKEGNRSYLKPEQLELLDKLHEYVTQGGTMAEFKSQLDKVDSPLDTVDSKVDGLDDLVKSNQSNDLELLVQVLSASVEKAITSGKSKSPLWYMKELKEATEEGWLLTTSQIQELIGVKPKTKKGENTYTRGSFSFVKSGKIGTQTAWKVKYTSVKGEK